MARLKIFGPEGQQQRELQPHNTLGRHPENTIQLLDRIVSKEHCHVDHVDGGWVLRDLGSLNGTYVNGERVSEHPLRHGDEISLGSTRMVFQTEESKATAPSTPPSKGSPFVTIAHGVVESHIHTKLAPQREESFLPEHLIQDVAQLRADYEKLRVSYEVIHAIGVELDVDKLNAKILDSALQLLPADRGVILLYDAENQLQPRCVRTKKERAAGEEVVLSTTIINEALRDKAAVLSSDASVDSRFQGAHSVIMQGIRSSMAVPLMHSEEVFGVMVLDSQVATNAFTEKDLRLFQNIANQAAIAVQNSLYAQKLEAEAVTRERFQRLLSPAIAEQVISGKVEVKKGGELRETTVLFSDIRGFTAMSESRSAQQVVDMLNEYFEAMVEIVFQHEGTLDKFVGDEIMALFGSPVSHHDDPQRAVRVGLKMMESLRVLNQARVARNENPLHIGIGINTGEVVAGYIGSSKALEYTVIGDVVNTGARLCSLAKAGEVIISEQTYERVKHAFEAVSLPAAHAKGKSKPLNVFRVVREIPSPLTDRTVPR